MSDRISTNTALRSLNRLWGYFAAASLVLLAGGFGLVWLAWQPPQSAFRAAARWPILPFLAGGYLLVVLRRNLAANHRPGEAYLLPGLGWGNLLTLLRGLFVAGMTGFLLLPPPAGWLAWLPGILYTLACVSDYFDGYVARATNHATRLGEILDISFDGVGVLAASLLAIRYGQVPTWYLAVGFARPLFLAGIWLRRRAGLPVYDLPPSPARRLFAGLQMGFLAVILLPVFSPPAAWVAAALFALPLLAGFLKDWFLVSGWLRAGEPHP